MGDSMKKIAWVTGNKKIGYELCVTRVDRAKDYHCLNYKIFPKYRAAQNIANAVNAACMPKPKTRKVTP